VPRPAPERNYRDRNHKPELICALTEFEALCGFRPVDRALALLDALAVPELDGVRTLLAGPDGIRAAFTMLLTDDDPHRIVDALVRRAAEEGDDTLAADALHVVRLLADDFPGDVGIALSLLLNYVRLQPGEAIFLGAGNVHCYLRGTGVEVMANSDNVLRCALTPKHVDVDEVLAVTDFTALAQPRCARRVDGGRARFEVPVADFDLTVVDLDGAPGALPLAVDGPCIVLCTDGQVSVSAAEVTVEVARGHAAFLAAGAVPRALRGAGRAFVAGVGATSRT
jgi:mannose-6-phosphate isomerase